ncbi:MAG TPA: HAMP domain-containing sensor histidine kinase [Solirubrobacterales bacterium]|nr:HAMP domain-containing sensor histidine kinase [Solirubrobacterales bacterium]
MTGLAEAIASWPLVLSLAAAMTVRSVFEGRRRSALNEALHELRRPVQSLVLAADGGAPSGAVEGSAQLASFALERLEREINGGAQSGLREEVFPLRPLAESAVARWRARASVAGGAVRLRWLAGPALAHGDRFALAQALDNLVVNAIEHGGPQVTVEAHAAAGRVRLMVADSGRASRPASRRETPAELVERLCGRRRRGHGLAVVRRTAAAHGGRFELRRGASGSVASLELPLLDDGAS